MGKVTRKVYSGAGHGVHMKRECRGLGRGNRGYTLEEVAPERILGIRQSQNEGQLISKVWLYSGLQEPRGGA